MGSVFDRSRLAALSDLETADWRMLYEEMEQSQANFLRHEAAFRSPAYRWPNDPLHTWSRVWEYPFAFQHLRAFRSERPDPPTIVDVGSGVTFFPFAVARLGCRVICVDNDPVCETDLTRAADHVTAAPGDVRFRLSDGVTLPLGDGEADAIYCISVLEHIPTFQRTVEELARVLKPGGLIILTFDIDLRGDSEIGPVQYGALRASLDKHFTVAAREETTHPRDLLHSDVGPFPAYKWEGSPWFVFKQAIKRLLGRPERERTAYRLAVLGLVLRKR
jgi:SAM-dependent methyltransferase